MKNALLVHGLGRTPFSMVPLAGPLRAEGFRTAYFGYSATFESMTRIVARLVKRIRALKPQVVVGHSLGGILLRHALLECADVPVDHLFMLGTPNRSPRVARYFWNWRAFRAFSGTCGRFLAHPAEYERLPAPAVPYTVFAGTVGLPKPFDLFRGEPNDGIVAVAETVIDPLHPPVPVSGRHSVLMNVREVRTEIASRSSEARRFVPVVPVRAIDSIAPLPKNIPLHRLA